MLTGAFIYLYQTIENFDYALRDAFASLRHLAASHTFHMFDDVSITIKLALHK